MAGRPCKTLMDVKVSVPGGRRKGQEEERTGPDQEKYSETLSQDGIFSLLQRGVTQLHTHRNHLHKLWKGVSLPTKF